MDDDSILDATPATTTVLVSSASGLVSCAPYLVGFTPHESLVLIFLTSPPQRQVAVTLRVDLVADSCSAADRDSVVEHISGSLNRAQHFGVDLAQVHMLVYSAVASALPGARFVAAALNMCQSSGIEVGEVLATDGESMWHYRDGDGRCGNAVAVPVARGEALNVQFELVAAGVGFVANREVLADSLASDPERQVSPSRLAAARRERDRVSRTETAALSWRQRAEDSLMGAMRTPYDAAEAYRRAPVWALALADARVREPVMHRLLLGSDPTARAGQLAQARSWLVGLVTMLGGSVRAPVAATLAAVAWQQGDGAFAGIAAEHALEADSTNRLGALIAAACSSGMPPATWADVLATFTLTELRTARPSALAS